MNRSTVCEVFISYASADRERVEPVASALRLAGITVWVDRDRIECGQRWAEEIVLGIQGCRAFLVMGSAASMRSWAVKQEIQIAGQREKMIFPILLEPIAFPAQVEFFLAGKQWVEVNGRPTAEWMPGVLRALGAAGVGKLGPPGATPPVSLTQRKWGLDSLLSLAQFTDQLWPIPARGPLVPTGMLTRDLGAPQEEVRHTYPLGDRLRLVLEADRPGHLLLLDEGPGGVVYCLCPSEYAPLSRIAAGRTMFPTPGSRDDAFVLTGQPGVEHLLAIIADDPITPGWPTSRAAPAHKLTASNIQEVLDTLSNRPVGTWTALSTSFRVVKS